MPRALVNDMTVPPAELVELASILDGIGPGKGPAILNAADRKIVSWALRLASRQEVSVEELARVIDPIAFGIKPSMYGLRSQQELERHVFVSGVRGVARDKARALLAEYSITKRTTEG